MATIRYTIAAAALSVAMTSRASNAQIASVSLTHTVVVTVPARVKVQVTPTLDQQQSAPSQHGLAVRVNATRAWVLVVGSKKSAGPTAQSVTSNADRTSSMVLYRSQSSKRAPSSGSASDSEPMMLTVVAP